MRKATVTMVLTISGDISEPRARQILEARFAPLTKGTWIIDNGAISPKELTIKINTTIPDTMNHEKQ